MHLTYTKFVFCKCLVQVRNFMNTANGTVARSSLTLLCSLLILILEQLPPLCQCSCFCSWLASLAGELIWQKTKLFSVKFSFALVSSHLHFSTAFPTAVELGLCGFLEILKWDLNIILRVCYCTSWMKKKIQYLCFSLWHLAGRWTLEVCRFLVSTVCLEYNFVPLLLFQGNGCTLLKFCHYNNSSSLQDSAKVSSIC